jgi:hypothetical protein
MSKLEDIRRIPLPEGAERVETGPIRFGDDWPGTFIRGDDSFFHRYNVARAIEWLKAKEHTDSSMDLFLARKGLEGLAEILDASNLYEKVRGYKWTNTSQSTASKETKT